MPSVAVITDSTASAGIDGSAAGLRVVPVSLLFSDGEASDPDVDPASVYARLAHGEVVKSQAPPPADYLDAIEVGDNESALVLTPAHEFTPMAHNARIAAELGCPTMCGRRYADRRGGAGSRRAGGARRGCSRAAPTSTS